MFSTILHTNPTTHYITLAETSSGGFAHSMNQYYLKRYLEHTKSLMYKHSQMLAQWWESELLSTINGEHRPSNLGGKLMGETLGGQKLSAWNFSSDPSSAKPPKEHSLRSMETMEELWKAGSLDAAEMHKLLHSQIPMESRHNWKWRDNVQITRFQRIAIDYPATRTAGNYLDQRSRLRQLESRMDSGRALQVTVETKSRVEQK